MRLLSTDIWREMLKKKGEVKSLVDESVECKVELRKEWRAR